MKLQYKEHQFGASIRVLRKLAEQDYFDYTKYTKQKRHTKAKESYDRYIDFNTAATFLINNQPSKI